jgi:hypothetical protein
VQAPTATHCLFLSDLRGGRHRLRANSFFMCGDQTLGLLLRHPACLHSTTEQIHSTAEQMHDPTPHHQPLVKSLRLVLLLKAAKLCQTTLLCTTRDPPQTQDQGGGEGVRQALLYPSPSPFEAIQSKEPLPPGDLACYRYPTKGLLRPSPLWPF